MCDILSWNKFVPLLRQAITEVLAQNTPDLTVGKEVTRRLHNARLRVSGTVIRSIPERLNFGIEIEETRFPVSGTLQAVVNAATCFVARERQSLLKSLSHGDAVLCEGTIGANMFVLPSIDWFVSPATGEGRIDLALSDVVWSIL